MRSKIRVLMSIGLLMTLKNYGQVNIAAGGVFYVSNNAPVRISGSLQNNGTFRNFGSTYVYGSISNSGTTTYDANGTLYLENGGASTVLTGSSVFRTWNLVLDNPSGYSAANTVSIAGTGTFNAGLYNAPDTLSALEFIPNGSGVSPAVAAIGVSDASHVSGYVIQRGSGNFIYPIGNSTMYQPIAANLVANASGMRCHYTATNAGAATYTTTGLGGSTPLLFYNQFEHWTLTPLSSATGSVTVYWDSYNNPGIGPDYATALSVAHKTPAGWNNEGASVVSGSFAAGSVTSNGNISSWSPFALGSTSVATTLPLVLSDFGADANGCDVTVHWESTMETDVSRYDVEYSADGIHFDLAGSLNATGSHYQYRLGHQPGAGTFIYRLAVSMQSGAVSYSSSASVHVNCSSTAQLSIFPNPVLSGSDLNVNMTGYPAAHAVVINCIGQQVAETNLQEGSNRLSTNGLSPGVYCLQIMTGNEKQTQRFVIQ